MKEDWLTHPRTKKRLKKKQEQLEAKMVNLPRLCMESSDPRLVKEGALICEMREELEYLSGKDSDQ